MAANLNVARTAAAAAASAATKFIHLTVFPRPRNLAESRQVLRLLQQYGEVTMFRNLKYEHGVELPNVSLAIFKDPEAGARLVREAPLTFTIEPDLTSFESEEKDEGEQAEGEQVSGEQVSGEQAEGEQVSGEQASDEYPVDEQIAFSSDFKPKEQDEGDAFTQWEKEWTSKNTKTIANEEFESALTAEQRIQNDAEELKRPSQFLLEQMNSYIQSMNTPAPSDEPTGRGALSDLVNELIAKSDSFSSANPTIHPHLPPPPAPPQPDPFLRAPIPEPPPPRKFRLKADLSLINHRDQVQKSHLHWAFHPEKVTMSYTALRADQHLRGLCDTNIGSTKIPYRVLFKYKADQWKSVREAWQEGQRAPGEVAKRDPRVGSDRLLGFQYDKRRAGHRHPSKMGHKRSVRWDKYAWKHSTYRRRIEEAERKKAEGEEWDDGEEEEDGEDGEDGEEGEEEEGDVD